MNKKIAALMLVVAAAAATPVLAAGPHGPHGGMMGGGMMMGGPGGCDMQRDKPFTVSQVRDILQGRIAWRGTDLKVGKVEEKDADTITAEILDPQGKLVEKVDVSRKTGHLIRPL